MTSASGEVAYSGGMGGLRRIAGPQLDRDAGLLGGPPQGPEAVQGDARLPQAAARPGRQHRRSRNTRRYYEAQALFQGDVAAWEKWNKLLVRQLKQAQQADGSFRGQFGTPVSTSLSLLALAVNFRFLPIYER